MIIVCEKKNATKPFHQLTLYLTPGTGVSITPIQSPALFLNEQEDKQTINIRLTIYFIILIPISKVEVLTKVSDHITSSRVVNI